MKINNVAILFILICGAAFSYPRTERKESFAEARQNVINNPSNTAYLSRLAAHFENRKQFTNAIDIYRKCMRLEPDCSDHYVRCAKAHLKNGRPDHAKPIILEARGYFPSNDIVISTLANTQYQLGDYTNALANFRKALGLSGKTNAYLLCGIAKACRELKNFESSEAYFIMAVRAKMDLWAYYEYGKLLIESRKFDKAVWALRKARSLGYQADAGLRDTVLRKLSLAHYLYGMHLKESGLKTEAKEQFESILNDRELQKTRAAERAAFWLKRL